MKASNVSCQGRMARQRGVGLIELMISIAIGLILVVLVTSYYLSSRQSYQTTVVSSEITDGQRYAVRLITRQLLLAGYSDYWFNKQTEFPATAASGNTPAFAEGQLISGDASGDLWLRLRPSALQNQQIVGCNNENLGADIDEFVVMRVGINGEGLFCQRSDNGGAEVPLLNGVEALVFEYLDDSDAFQFFPAITDWSSVRAVRLNLILRSETPTFDNPVNQTFAWMGGNYTANDRFMRTAVTRVVTLRNQ